MVLGLISVRPHHGQEYMVWQSCSPDSKGRAGLGTRYLFHGVPPSTCFIFDPIIYTTKLMTASSLVQLIMNPLKDSSTGEMRSIVSISFPVAMVTYSEKSNL